MKLFGVIDLGIIVSLILAAIPIFWGWQKFQRWRTKWEKLHFPDQVIFTLNTIDNNSLKIRTLIDTSLADCLQNEFGVAAVKKAAEKTSLSNPFIDVGEKNWAVLNNLLNTISGRFAEGFIAKDAGLPTKTLHYLLALTWERGDDLRTEKLRVMLIQKDHLQLFDSDEFRTSLNLELAHHSQRVETLRMMHALHAQDSHQVRQLELVVSTTNSDRET